MKRISSLLILSLFIACSKSKNASTPQTFQPNLEQEFADRQKICEENLNLNTLVEDPLKIFENGYFQIFNSKQLVNLAATPSHWNKNFRIMTHIDLAGEANLSIGTNRTPFTGNLDGSYCNISGLKINTGETSALFAYTSGALLEKISIQDFYISGNISGSLIGISHDTNVSKILVSNTIINGKVAAGGILAVGSDSQLSQVSTSRVEVSSETFAGGITGRLVTFDLTNQSVLEYFLNSETIVIAKQGAGALLGGVVSSKVFQGISSGRVESEELGGGLVGTALDSEFSEVISLANLRGTNTPKGYVIGEDDESRLYRVYFNSGMECSLCTMNENIIPIIDLEQLYNQNAKVYRNWDFENFWSFGPGKSGPMLNY